MDVFLIDNLLMDSMHLSNVRKNHTSKNRLNRFTLVFEIVLS